jgi:D-alanyl-D-alanine carboxypeptidase
MINTHFTNPAGFDDSTQYSTAADLAKLAKVITANPLIAKIVTTKSTVVTDVSGNKTYFLENVNKLLGIIEGIEGVKTGQTEGSLEILITKTTRNNNSIITAVLGSQDRFGESKELINWSFENFTWQNN